MRMTHKICTKCQENKPIIDFDKQSDRPNRRSHCKICLSKKAKLYIEANKDAIRSYQTKYQEIHRDYYRQKSIQWSKNNPEKIAISSKRALAKLKAENPIEYSARVAYSSALAFCRSKNRVPKWLTKEQKAEIKEFYILAKELAWLSEDKLVVDHIVPINGKNVSGLHVPWNLQILTNKENCSKGNKV